MKRYWENPNPSGLGHRRVKKSDRTRRPMAKLLRRKWLKALKEDDTSHFTRYHFDLKRWSHGRAWKTPKGFRW